MRGSRYLYLVRDAFLGAVAGSSLGVWSAFSLLTFINGFFFKAWEPARFHAMLTFFAPPSAVLGVVLGARVGVLRRRRAATSTVGIAPSTPERSATGRPIVLFVLASMALGGGSATVLLRGGRQMALGAIVLLVVTVLVVATICVLTGRALRRGKSIESSSERAAARRRAQCVAGAPIVATSLAALGVVRWPTVSLVTVGVPAVLVIALGTLLPLAWFATTPSR